LRLLLPDQSYAQTPHAKILSQKRSYSVLMG
jgi:hypothetical protein